MARTGSGTYNLPEAPFTTGTVISSTAMNSNLSDIAGALTQSIAKDGQTVPTANLPMGNFRLTGLGAASALTDAPQTGQVQNFAFNWVGSYGGSVNAQTASPTPAMAALAAGQMVIGYGVGSPTALATLAVSGLTAKPLRGRVVTGRPNLTIYDGASYWNQPIADVMAGHIYGLTLSNNGADANNDIDIAIGECASDNQPYVRMILPAAITKRSDAAWAAGTGNGAMDTGTKPTSGTLHWHLIEKDSDGAVDALCSISATAPTMPSGYSARRRIGSTWMDAGSNLIAFTQVGDEFLRSTAGGGITDGAVGTGARTTVAVNVPAGVAVDALLDINLANATVTPTYIYMTALSQSDEALSASSGRITLASGFVSGSQAACRIRVRTNTSRQIGYRGLAGAGSIVLNGNLYGWIDTRGRNAT